MDNVRKHAVSDHSDCTDARIVHQANFHTPHETLPEVVL